MMRILLRIYGTLAAIVFALAVALDASFFAHFERAYSYTTPLPRRDLANILLAFRPLDLLVNPLTTILFLLAMATLVTIHLRRPNRRWQVGLAIPQLLLLFSFAQGISGLLYDVSRAKDGEWLHEGWPLMEAAAIWVPIPFCLVASAAVTFVKSRLSFKTPATTAD